MSSIQVRRHLLLCLSMVLCPLMASTEVFFGTILKVGPDGKSINVAIEMFNYTNRGEESVRKKDIPAQSIIFLDGQESTAAEALQAGRAVMWQDHGKFLFVSSQTPGPDAQQKAQDPSTAIHRLLVSKAVTLPLKGKRGVKDEEVAIELVIDVVDGKIVDGVAMPRIAAWQSQDLDCSGLSFVDGAIQGSASVTISHPTIQKEQPLTVPLRLEQGSAVVALAEEKQVKLTARVLPRADGDAGKAWFRIGIPGPLFRDHLFAVFPLADGKAQEGGHHWYHKGKITGTITENAVTFDGKTLTGSFRSQVIAGGAASGDQVAHAFKLDARVLGGRYLFGSITMMVGEQDKAQSYQGAIRGGIVAADSPIGGLSYDIKKMFEERYPKKKK